MLAGPRHSSSLATACWLWCHLVQPHLTWSWHLLQLLSMPGRFAAVLRSEYAPPDRLMAPAAAVQVANNWPCSTLITLWPPAEDMALGASARMAMMHSLSHNEGLADMLGEAHHVACLSPAKPQGRVTASREAMRAGHHRACAIWQLHEW